MTNTISNATRKAGRPPKGERREPLAILTFRADPATVRALGRLEAALGAGFINGRSVAIRRAILEAAARIGRREGR